MRLPPSPLAREALLAATLGMAASAALVWLGPLGGDFAAHLYQRTLFIEHGFALWNNFWYAGRYSFVNYSIVYYPLAALLGIRLLAVLTVTVGAAAFAVLVGREWGAAARWSSRTFALACAAVVLTGEFPFALGIAFALLALCALQAGGRVSFGLLVLLTAATSPLALLLLCVVLAGVAVERRRHDPRFRGRAALVAIICFGEVLLWRAFPGGGHYPFSLAEAGAAFVFCGFGLVLTWRVEAARLLRYVFLVYLCACAGLFLVPMSIGEDIARLRFVAIPIAVLALSLRSWRPRPIVFLALALAISWNVSSLAATVATSADDPAANASYWTPAVDFLKAHLTPSYRVEAVDTAGHWPAVYLARSGIPLARGWFRQNDFPQNRVLYHSPGPGAYRHWLRSLGVRYVVLSAAAPDYSARREQQLLENGESGLPLVFSSRNLSIYEVPRPRAIVSGPGRARILSFQTSGLVLDLAGPGDYRVAVSYSPYWSASSGCVSEAKDGMVRLHVAHAGRVKLRFAVKASTALEAVAGIEPGCGK